MIKYKPFSGSIAYDCVPSRKKSCMSNIPPIQITEIIRYKNKIVHNTLLNGLQESDVPYYNHLQMSTGCKK